MQRLDFGGDSQLRNLYRQMGIRLLQRLDFGGDSQFRQQNRLRGIRLLQRLDFGGDSQLRHLYRQLCIPGLYLESRKLP